MYWDTTYHTWSDQGCHLTSSHNDALTTCSCNHLTNFALFMDFMGTADPQDPFLDTFSIGILSISCLCIIVTEALLSITTR